MAYKPASYCEKSTKYNWLVKYKSIQYFEFCLIFFQDLEIYDLMLTNEQGDEDSDSDSAEDFSTSSNNMTNSMLMTNSALMTNSVIEMASAFEKGQISSGSAFEGSNLKLPTSMSAFESKLASALSSSPLKSRNLEVLGKYTFYQTEKL